jgi:hypothetical protein
MRKILTLASLLALAAAPPPAQHPERSSARPGELILHQMINYNGDYYTIDFDRTSVETEWNIRSISIHEGERWEICARTRYRDCIELSQSLPDASTVGINGQIGSARRIRGN